jgi:hypothetical protein
VVDALVVAPHSLECRQQLARGAQLQPLQVVGHAPQHAAHGRCQHRLRHAPRRGGQLNSARRGGGAGTSDGAGEGGADRRVVLEGGAVVDKHLARGWVRGKSNEG